jgi:hypothetical protein
MVLPEESFAFCASCLGAQNHQKSPALGVAAGLPALSGHRNFY